MENRTGFGDFKLRHPTQVTLFVLQQIVPHWNVTGKHIVYAGTLRLRQRVWCSTVSRDLCHITASWLRMMEEDDERDEVLQAVTKWLIPIGDILNPSSV